MPRGEQILRQWRLLRTLQTRGEGMSLRQLAQEVGVSERTIQRDFELLQELGFPLEHDKDDYGKRLWRMPHDFFRSGPLVLSLTEAVSLHLADRLLSPLTGTYLAEGLNTILDKIRSLVPQRAMDHFAALDDIITVRRMGATDYRPLADTIRVLVDAAQQDKTVEVRYHAVWRGEEYTTRFDPYGLVLFDGDLFAIGRSHRASAIRTFKVARVRNARPTDDHFKRPADFSLERQFRSSFGIGPDHGAPVEITVKFTGSAAALIEERVWHESQQIAWQPAEATLFEPAGHNDPHSLTATYRLTGVVEFKRWIKGFGDQAEILKPTWLRDELREELTAAASLYHG